jgi:hypothetical protein
MLDVVCGGDHSYLQEGYAQMIPGEMATVKHREKTVYNEEYWTLLGEHSRLFKNFDTEEEAMEFAKKRGWLLVSPDVFRDELERMGKSEPEL